MISVRFAKLQASVPDDIPSGSHQRVIWICDCGRRVSRMYRDAVRGRTTSCGRCGWISVEEASIRKFGSLRMANPVEIAPQSGKTVSWLCDCGNETEAVMRDVFTGHTKSCGKCVAYGRTKMIPAAEMAHRQFGRLRMKHPCDVIPGSHRKAVWLCDCGRDKAIDINSVMLGKSKSCGHCDDISSAEMSIRKFGRLRLKTPKDTPPGSGKRAVWVCDCGNETRAMIAHVVSGHTRSCGRCLLSMQVNFARSKQDIRLLRTPIEPHQLPDWCPIALETIVKVSKPFRAMCRLCGREYAPRWDGIRLGNSLTCGCSTSRVSMNQQEIHEFIVNLGLEASLEHSVNGMKYDIFIPSAGLVVEFAGLKWHSYADSLRRDLAKRRNAVDSGLRHVMIFEDEWMSKRSIMEDLLRNALKKSSSTSVRPSKCMVERIEAKEADLFHEKFHYIGAARAPVNYGVFHKGELIACCSFKKPTRQSKHDWELARMASDPRFRVHGMWSKVVRQFVSELRPRSIVTFSDDRLFTGDMYEKIGFKFDGLVKPSRYWWRNRKRRHQSALRKPKGEVRTEAELRKSQGWSEIWDLGKKRWVLTPATISSAPFRSSTPPAKPCSGSTGAR